MEKYEKLSINRIYAVWKILSYEVSFLDYCNPLENILGKILDDKVLLLLDYAINKDIFFHIYKKTVSF